MLTQVENPLTYVEKTATGVITRNNISETLDEQGS